MNPLDLIRSHLEAGRFGQARELLLRHLQRNPKDPNLNNLMAIALAQQGKHDQAIFHAQRACDVLPSNVMLMVNLATCMVGCGRTEEAIAKFQAAFKADPRNAEAATGLINALNIKSRFAQAAAVAEQALKAHPSDVLLHFAAAAAMLNSGRAAESLATIRRALELDPGRPMLQTRLAAGMLYAPGVAAQEMFNAHRDFAQSMRAFVPAETSPPPLPSPSDADRRLCIGLLSSDFHEHAVSKFLMPLLAHLDKASFEIICYHNQSLEDHQTQRLRAMVSGWRNVTSLSEEALAAAIRQDKVDILVEVIGLSAHPCPLTLMLKPAPLVISWMGYPASTALPTIDYRIVDSLTDPAGAESLHTERLIRLDPCFLCFPLPDQPPPVREPHTGITFGCFNTVQKISDELLRTWAAILNSVEGSRLLIKSNGLQDPLLQEQLRQRIARAGLDPARAEILPPTKTQSEHLAWYGKVDIALDTYPYCGTTTTCDALTMGVPVVSRFGDAHARRVGVSLLTVAGLPELCVPDEQGYINAAIALAKNPARLAELHKALPAQVAKSPLCDQPAFAKRFGEALRQAWRELCLHAATS
jgi:predicted O-linked N-acetylglucosamine transferase (SPINDLY family)